MHGVCSGTADVPVQVIDNNNGTYTVQYTPYKTGPYSLEMKAPDGTRIGGKTNPVPILCTPAAADGSQSVAFGPGVTNATIGKDNKFTVQARDAFGNDIKHGGDKVAGSLQAPDGSVVPLQIHDNKDGTYTATYPGLNKAGPHALTPTVAGSPVKDAPFRLEVNSGETDPSKTKTTLKPDVSGYDVELRDAHGNKRVQTKKDKVICKARPTSVLEFKAHRKEDGSFEVKWPGNFRGDYTAEILVNGSQAPGGPFNGSIPKIPVREDHKAVLNQAVPSVAALMARLLENATPAERNRIISALGGGDGGKSSSSSSDDN